MNTDLSISTRPFFARSFFNALNKERWSFLITLIFLLGLAGVIIRRIPYTYSSSAKVLIEYPRSTEQLTGLNDQVELGRLDAVGEKVNPINNQVALLGSYPIFKKALAQLNLPEETFPFANLTVKPLTATDLIEVSYKSPSPEISATATQAVVEVYIQENQLTNRKKGSSAREFLERRLPQLKNQLQQNQDKLAEFQTQNRFLGTAIETDALTKTLIDLKAQVNAAQVQLAFTEEKAEQLKTQLPANLNASVNATGVSQDPSYQQLQTKLLEAEATLADLQVRLTDQNPQVVSAKNKRDRLIALIQQHSNGFTLQSTNNAVSPIDPLRQRLVEQWIGLETERSAQASQLNKLYQQLRQTQQLSEQLPLLIKQQTQLQLAVETAQQEYLIFKEKYNTSQIAEQQTISNVRIVELAEVMPFPIAPNRKLLYAIALVVSTGVALGVTWLCYRRNDTLDGVDELRAVLPLPVLATVPWTGDGLLAHEASVLESDLGYSYQLLQAHIRMLPQHSQVIAVCSGVATEGRSSVATNLAAVETLAGHRVLLIDADGQFELRPQSNRQNINSDKKASNYDSSSDSQKADYDILPYRNTPAPFLYKDWLILLEQSRQQYDLVIVDCPPALYSPDATVIASMCDGVLWVTCPQRLGRKGAEACAENLHTWGTRLLGQVVVGVDSQQPSPLTRENSLALTPPLLRQNLEPKVESY